MKHSTFTIHHLPGRILLTAAILFVMTLTCSAQDKRYHGDGPDDVLRFVPMLTAYTLKAAGVESSSSWKRFMDPSERSFLERRHGITCQDAYYLYDGSGKLPL